MLGGDAHGDAEAMLSLEANFGDQLDDSIGVVNVPSTWRMQADTREATTMTSTIKMVNAKVQVVKRADAETSTDVTPAPFAASGGAEQGALERFLRARTALTVAALRQNARSSAFDGYDTTGDDGLEPVECRHALKHVGGLASNAPECVTAVAWNCTGALVAASYGALDARDGQEWRPTKSVLAAWAVTRRTMDPSKADVLIELGDCIACLAFHPEEPTLLAGGSYNGDLHVWDIGDGSNDDEPTVHKSTLSDYTHHEPVLKLAWVRMMRGGYQLVSAGADGRVLQWRPTDSAHGLRHPTGGFTLVAPTARASAARGAQQHAAASAGGARRVVHGVTALSFSSEDPTSFVVGVEAGLVLKASLTACEQRKPHTVTTAGSELVWTEDAAVLLSRVPYADYQKTKLKIEKAAILAREYEVSLPMVYNASPAAAALFVSPVTFSYEPHAGPVYDVAHSPFHRNLFLSVSTDSAVRLCSMLQANPLLTLYPSSSSVFCAAWSTSRPTVFAVGCADGRLYVYDLLSPDSSGQHRPVETLQVGSHPVFSVAFNKKSALVATGDGDGFVKVWKLSGWLSTMQLMEADKLDHFVSKLSAADDGEEQDEEDGADDTAPHAVAGTNGAAQGQGSDAEDDDELAAALATRAEGGDLGARHDLDDFGETM